MGPAAADTPDSLSFQSFDTGKRSGSFPAATTADYGVIAGLENPSGRARRRSLSSMRADPTVRPKNIVSLASTAGTHSVAGNKSVSFA